MNTPSSTRGARKARPDRTQRPLLIIITATLAIAPIALTRGTPNAFDVAKMAVLLVGAGVCLPVLVLRLATSPTARPSKGTVITLAAWAIALVLSSAAALAPGISVLGYYPRLTGLPFYLGLAVLLLAVHAVGSSPRPVVLMLRGFVGAATVVSIYALAQYVGADPLTWETQVGGAFSTLGNGNHVSGLLAIAVPAGILLAVIDTVVPWRVLGGMSAAAAVVALPATGSSQGYAGVAAALVALPVMRWGIGQQEWAGRVSVRIRYVAIVAALLVGAAIAVLVLRSSAAVQDGLVERRFFYETAVTMAKDDLLTGVGVDNYAVAFTRERPIEHVRLAGPQGADDVHSVPLTMLAEAGLFGLLTWLALNGWIAVSAIRLRLTTTEREMVWLISGLSAMFVAFLVQSLVSVEHVSTALGWVLAGGAILGLRAGGSRPPSTERRRKPGVSPGGRVSAYVTVATVVGIVLISLGVRPVAAEWSARGAAIASEQGDGDAAVEGLSRAIDRGPHIPLYKRLLASLLTANGELDAAFDLAAEAAGQDPGSAQSAMEAADLAFATGREEDAALWWEEAVTRDPLWGGGLERVGRFRLSVGQFEEVLDVGRRLEEVQPDAPGGLLLQAQALLALDRVAEARDAFEEALARAPSNEEALNGLALVSEIDG